MNRKILTYELKRILCSKIYVITFIIAILFSIFDLYTQIIQGVSGTAPFSKWSYCKFLCDINTILLFILMLLCTELFSKNEQKVREITSCTLMSQKKYLMIRSLALFFSYFFILVTCILISLIFYKTTFDFIQFSSFLLPMLIILFPTFTFVFGISLVLGKRSQTLLYLWIPIVLILSLINIKNMPLMDMFAKGYVTNMPNRMPVNCMGEPIFQLSLSFLLNRGIFTFIGIACFCSIF